MKKAVFFTFLLMCFFIAPSLGFSYDRVHPRGPMPIRNQMPMYLFWYAFPQEKARVADYRKFDAVFDYTVSNVIVDKVTTPTEEYVIRMDMEVNRLNLNLKYGLFEKLEVAFELPYIITSKGYLDGFVEGFERSVGATAVGARKRTEDYKYDFYFSHNDNVMIRRTEPASGLGDTALSAKYMLMDENEGLPRVSVRAAVKFPTASETKLLGSGKFDYGAGLLADKSFGRLFAYANLSAVIINKPNFLDELNMKNFIASGMGALEYCFTERFSGVVQGTWHSTPYPTTGVDPLKNQAGEVAFGLNYQFTENSSWHIAVVENLFADSTPDVTFQLGGNIKI